MDSTDPTKPTPLQIAARKALRSLEAEAAADPDSFLAEHIRMNQALALAVEAFEKSTKPPPAGTAEQLPLFPADGA